MDYLFQCNKLARSGVKNIVCFSYSVFKYLKKLPLGNIVLVVFTKACSGIQQLRFFGNLAPGSISPTLLCTALIFGVTTVYAQQDSSQTVAVEVKEANLSEVALIERAQEHRLMGELAAQMQRIDESKQHFLDASVIYKDLEDAGHYILSLVEYAVLFFEEEEYDDGFNILDELLPLASEHGEDQPIAAVLKTQGYAHYDQSHYNDAITAFENALKYMSAQDEDTQTQLGLIYHQIGQAYKKLKNSDKSVLFHKKALDVFTVLEDQKLIARAFKNVATAENNRDKPLVALEYLIRSVEIHSELNDPDEHAEVLMLGGIIYRTIGRYEKSLEYIHEAYLIYKGLDNVARIAETSNQMGHLYKSLGQHEQARSFYQLSIDLPEDKVAPKTLASALRELAMIDFKTEKYEFAMESAQKAYTIYDNINDKSKGSATARTIGEIYQSLGNNSKAITFYRQALSLANESGSVEDQVKTLNALGRALVGSNNDEATVLLRESLELATKANILNDKLSTYIALRKAEKSRGNFAEALSLAEEEIALTKILNEEKEKNNFSRAKALLDSHKMELELEFLRNKVEFDELELAQKTNEIEIVNQSNQISELELVKNRYANFLLATLLLICTLVAIYIYRISVVTKERNKELDYLAARDPLTNCYNRRILFDLMNRDFADLEQFSDYSIIMVDIDHFKRVNDTHGHSEGDSVLREVASILQGSVRQSDIVARYGGEEFCIICPHAPLEQAINIAENIRKKIEASYFNDIKITCSFGLSSIKFNAKLPEKLIDQADMALYRSKASGRNQVTVWEPLEGKGD